MAHQLQTNHNDGKKKVVTTCSINNDIFEYDMCSTSVNIDDSYKDGMSYLGCGYRHETDGQPSSDPKTYHFWARKITKVEPISKSSLRSITQISTTELEEIGKLIGRPDDRIAFNLRENSVDLTFTNGWLLILTDAGQLSLGSHHDGKELTIPNIIGLVKYLFSKGFYS